jgi:ribonuclease BN (tRNA processing enzyme)
MDNNNETVVVYDCGAKPKNKKSLLKEIKDLFPEGKGVIDTLFISHFDDDHVSGILELAKKNKIKRIVLPQFSKQKWFCYAQASINAYNDIKSLLDYLDRTESDVVEVVGAHGSDEDSIDNHPNENEDFPNNNKKNSKHRYIIKSGKHIRINNICSWVYVPINFYASSEILSELESKIRQVEKEDGSLLTIDELETKADSLTKNIRVAINGIYHDVIGDNNKPSMLVYSGLFDISKRINIFYNNHCNSFSRYYRCFYPNGCLYLEGCLYTGDATLSSNKRYRYVKKYLGDLTYHIGTLQLPHHGSKNNFVVNTYEESLGVNLEDQFCFASYGCYNSYGHPSSLILTNLSFHHSIFHGVTEQKDTILIEHGFY